MIIQYSKILIVLGWILAFILIFSLLTFILYIRPPKYTTPGNPSSYGLKYEAVSFKTKDGLTLRGWFIPSEYSNATIIVGHGFPFDKSNILPVTKFLNTRYNLFYYDFRYFGESEGKITTIAYKEQQDLLEAIEYLKNRKDVENIGIMGFSLSATTALLINSKDIKAIVSDSAYLSIPKALEKIYFIFPWIVKYPFIWATALYAKIFLGINIYKISALENVKTLETPILFIHGEKDSQISVEHSKILNHSALNSTLWIIEGADHGQSFAINPEEYKKRVLNFFDKYMSK